MNDHDLNTEIARVTGESLDTIEALGFSLWTPASPIHEPRPASAKILRFPRSASMNVKPRPRARAPRTRRARFVPKIVVADTRRDKVLTMDFDRPKGA